jgi:hypothetical protein
MLYIIDIVDDLIKSISCSIKCRSPCLHSIDKNIFITCAHSFITKSDIITTVTGICM